MTDGGTVGADGPGGPARRSHDDRPGRLGRLFVVSGPSGVGKGTVVRGVLAAVPGLTYSVSRTTRPPRHGEVDGLDYVFVSAADFDGLVEDGAFLEWAEVFGHRYGTLRAPIADRLERGYDAILEIDVQGAARVLHGVPDAVLIFLRPPSQGELARRLRGRGTEREGDMERRLAEARRELAQATWFHHVVVNDEMDRAVADVAAIIAGTR